MSRRTRFKNVLVVHVHKFSMYFTWLYLSDPPLFSHAESSNHLSSPFSHASEVLCSISHPHPCSHMYCPALILEQKLQESGLQWILHSNLPHLARIRMLVCPNCTSPTPQPHQPFLSELGYESQCFLPKAVQNLLCQLSGKAPNVEYCCCRGKDLCNVIPGVVGDRVVESRVVEKQLWNIDW